MNKINKVLLAIIGAIDAVANIATPIVLALLWVKIFGLQDWGSYLFYGIGLIATIFRAIKIGWMK